MCQKSKKQGKKDNSSMIEQLRNKAEKIKSYRPGLNITFWIILLVVIALSVIILFSYGLEWYGKWGFGMPKNNNNEPTSNVYPDFLGGFIGVVGGFLIELSIIQKIRNHIKRRRIINALKEEFYDIIRQLWKRYYGETTKKDLETFNNYCNNSENVPPNFDSIENGLNFNGKKWKKSFEVCFYINVLYSMIVTEKTKFLKINPITEHKKGEKDAERNHSVRIRLKGMLAEEAIASTENVFLLYSGRCKKIYIKIYNINSLILDINDVGNVLNDEIRNEKLSDLITELMDFFLLVDNGIRKQVKKG